MSNFGVLGMKHENKIVIFEISTLEFVKNEFLTYIVNFGTGSTFSKGQGSAFSEGPSLGSDMV